MFSLFIISGIVILYTITTKLSHDNISSTKSNLDMFSISIFNILRNVMNTGDSALIKKAENDSRNISGVENLDIIKSKALIELYAPHESFTNNTLLLEVFEKKENKIIEIHTNDKHSLRMLKPMIASNECLSCHANQKEGDVIGVMDISFSLNQYDKNVEETIWEIVLVSSFLALLNIGIILYLIQRATQPIEGLKHGFRRLLDSSQSHNDIQLKARTKDEIGEVINLFNQYMDKLNKEIKEDTHKFANSIIDSQTNLIITTKDKKQLHSANKAFFDFFSITSIDEFFTNYGSCVCDVFENDSEGTYLQKEIDGVNWRDYINMYPSISHKVKMKGHIFNVNLNYFSLNDTVYYTSVFTDITKLENNTIEINQSHEKIQKLLDSANQGFLYFDKNMIIGSEYSTIAENIFPDVTIAHQDISKLLYDNEEKQQFLKETLQYIFKQDEDKQEIVISLLDKEFVINGKNIEVEYKILSNELCMIILTDITDKIALNNQLEQEKQILKMIVAISINTEQFLEIQDSYNALLNNIDEYKSINQLPFLRREVHTLKGLFAQKEMLHIVQHLHSFETLIDECLKKDMVTKELQAINSQTMNGWLEDDLAILKVILGQDFFTKINFISINKERIDTLLSHVEKASIQNNNYYALKPLIEEIEKLKLHNIKTFLNPYIKLVEQLSIKLNKSINPLKIVSKDIYIQDKYKEFLNSLVHIFRNSVDHGIETSDIREERLKNIYGTIECKVIEKDNNITISISDDGNGLEIEKLKELSIKRGIYTQEQIDTLESQEILQVIFTDAFTTADTVTTISGRGVGLSSVLNELKKLNGSLQIDNNFTKGVSFIFTLPK
jgi:two-component system chemotaxis sensor kinase CheA